MLYKRYIMAFTILLLPNATIHAQHVGEPFIHILGFTLYETTLDNVQQQLGQAPLSEQGDAGEYVASICYFIPNIKTTIIFSSGELGGSERTFLGYTVRQSNEPMRHCTALKQEIEKSTLEIGGLKLDMTREEFTKLFGPNIKWYRNRGYFSITGQDPLSQSELKEIERKYGIIPQPYYDVHISISGKFRSGRLIEFSVWKTRTL